MDAQVARRKRLNELLETSKGKTYFVVFVTFLFTSLLILFGLLPSYSAFLKQSEQNILRAQHIEALKEKLGIMETLVIQNQEKSALKGIFNEILPVGFNQLNYVKEVNQIALRYGMTLRNIVFSTTEDLGLEYVTLDKDRDLRAMLLSIQLEGSKESITNFIKDLESSIRLYNIVDITIARKSSEELLTDSTRPYRYTLFAQTYFFDNPNE